MSFFIRRSLASGPIRFGVGERLADPTGGEAPGGRFSTGGNGEYLRLRGGGVFYSDEAINDERAVPPTGLWGGRKESVLPLWAWASIVFGAILILLGILVVINKGYRSGYVESAVGVAFIVLPFAVTAKKRREMRLRIERERVAREAHEAHIREIAGAFIDRTSKLRSADDHALLEEIRRAREGAEIPYENMAPSARAATLRAAFDALDRWKDGGRGVARAIDEVAGATGLNDSDRTAIRLGVLQRVWWHLLADDRMGAEQRGRVEELRVALGIPPEALTIERQASDEFERLRGLGPKSLPAAQCEARLKVLESCLHVTRGHEMQPKRTRLRPSPESTGTEWRDGPVEDLIVTNQRLLSHPRKSLDISLRDIWDLEVDLDDEILSVVTGGEKKRQIFLRVPDPVYTAGVIQAAMNAPLKPKGLV
ncbi:MAG TPA: hypothetical protein VM557_00340 [Thermoanaerobaculia bacterium]|nr:hypothetical protein [Thermoanaerobaculia bacterium]